MNATQTLDTTSGHGGLDHLFTPTVIRRVAAITTGLAGAIHYAVVPEHRSEWLPAAILFTLVGAVQLSWAVLAWPAARRGLLLTGGAVNLAALGAWFISRVWGMPVGPHAHIPEAIGAADLITALSQAVAIAAVVLAILRRPTPPTATTPSDG